MTEEMVPIAGSTRHPLVGAESIASVGPDEQMTATVYVRPNPAAPALDLEAEAAKLPQARHYMSPEEIETNFGADPKDLEAVANFAEANDLQVTSKEVATRSVKLAGTAAAFAKAFGVDLSVWRHEGIEYRGRVGEIHVPAALAPIVEAVLGLDNRPIGRPYLRSAGVALTEATLQAEVALQQQGLQLPPNTYLPPTVGQLYGFPAAFNGQGETVAVFVFNGQIGSSSQSAPGGYDPALLNAYFSKLLDMAPPALTDVVVHGPGNQPGNGSNAEDVSGEVYLDLCVVGSLAPGARIVVYFTEFTEQGWVDAVSHAVTDTVNDPSVLSISYGNPEDDPRHGLWTEMAVQQVNRAFQAAAAAGRTICCAAGDDGATDEPGTEQVHADFPASSPWVLACGGTRLTATGTTIQSEVVWNDLQAGHGATGGGISKLFAVPNWQQHANVPPAHGTQHHGRGVPDVSSLADPETPFVVVGPDGKAAGVGGTSAAAPLWASLVARLNQALGTRVGYLNPLLYTRCADGVLRDITQGNNGVYPAEVGWDACTGLGSPDATRLLGALQGAQA
jgi:kumamolisin